MTDLAWIWLYTVATIVGTSVIFTVLAIWSAGGATPWSIIPSLVRSRTGPEASDGALPPLRLNVPGGLDRPRGLAVRRASAVDESAVRAELEDLGTRHL